MLTLLVWLMPLAGRAAIVTERGPAYSDYPINVSLDARRGTTISPTGLPYTIGQRPVGRIRLTVDEEAQWNGGVLQGAYVTVTVPESELITEPELALNNILFEGTPPDYVTTSVKFQYIEGTGVVFRINLADLTANSVLSTVDFYMNFSRRVIPNGFVQTPTISMYDGENRLISSVKGVEFEMRSSPPTLTKYVGSNINQTAATNGQSYYGGVVNAEHTAIEAAQDVAFMYKLSKTDDSLASLSPPRIVRVVITDTLPTYTDANGETKTAVFEPSKNPGWTLSADGTQVTYKDIQGSTEPRPGGDLFDTTYGYVAEDALAEVKLVLSFPNAKTSAFEGVGAQGPVTSGITDLITNRVDAVMYPINGDLVENDGAMNRTDTVQFELTGIRYNMEGAITKKSNTSAQIAVINGKMHHTRPSYQIKVTNTASVPMTNIVVRDEGGEPLTFLYYMMADSAHQQYMKEMAVYDAQGDRHVVWSKGDEVNNFKLDPAMFEDWEKQVEKVNSGVMAVEDFSVERWFDRAELVMDEDFVLAPAESFIVNVTSAFLNPYTMVPGTTLSNRASFSGNFVDGEELVPFRGEVSAELLTLIKAVVGLNLFTENQSPGTPYKEGDQVTFSNHLSMTNFPLNMNFKNARFIDVLPPSLRADAESFSFVTPEHSITVSLVENFQGSGWQAIIVQLPEKPTNDDFNTAYALSRTEVTVTDQAAEIRDDNWMERNRHRIYFTADGWNPLLEDVTSNTLVDDIYDINNNGLTTDKVIGASAYFSARLNEIIRGSKQLRTDSMGSFTTGTVEANYGEGLRYALVITNRTTETVGETRLYDTLPRPNDLSYNVDEQTGEHLPRGSQFAVGLTGPVELPAGSQAEVLYRLDQNPPADPETAIAQQGVWYTEQQVPAGNWKNVSAIYIRVPQVPPQTIYRFEVPAKAPDYTAAAPYNRLVANNTVAVSFEGATFGESPAVTVVMRVTFPVTKVWLGPGPHEPVTIELYQNGVPVPDKTLTLSEDNGWQGLFENLPLKTFLGEDAEYTVRERVSGQSHAGDVVGDDTNGFTITNSPRTKVVARKIWDNESGYDPDTKTEPPVPSPAVWFVLYRDGVVYRAGQLDGTADAPQPDGSGERTAWTYTFDGLPTLYDDGEGTYTYTVGEPEVPPDYVRTTGVDDAGNTIILNTFRQGTFTAYKQWDGNIPRPEITMQLYRLIVGDTAEPPYKEHAGTGVLDGIVDDGDPRVDDGEFEPWSYTWHNLIGNDEEGLITYKYTVEEQEVPEGYVQVDTTSSASTNIRNMATITWFTARKNWVGAPEEKPEVLLQLYRDATPIGDAVPLDGQVDTTLQEDGSGELSAWQYTWKNLPRFAEDGTTEHAYRFEEVDVPDGYAARLSADGTVLTNLLIQPAQVQISANKALSGGSMSAGQFSFTLADEEGNVLQTNRNDAQGNVVFEPIEFTEPGDYRYQVSEVAGSDPRVTYDTSRYVLNFHIGVGDDGRLTRLLPQVWKNGEPIGENAPLRFANSIRYESISVDPGDGVKILQNAAIKPGQFSFVVKDAGGNTLETVTNDAKGRISFSNRRFSLTGTFIYTITEVPGEDKHIQYDDTVYRVIIKVSDVAGGLDSQVSLEKDGVPYSGEMRFTNTMKLPSTGDSTMQRASYIALAALALLGMYWLLIRRKQAN